MEIDYNLIGARLKKARLQKGFSQVKLSEILDVSEVYLSRIEKGKTRISLKRLVQMSEVLDISICEIITGSAEKSKEYLYREILEVLEKCTPEKRKLIYHMAMLVANVKN